MSKVKVSIIGGAGYGAAELLRHLAVSNHADLIRVAAFLSGNFAWKTSHRKPQ